MPVHLEEDTLYDVRLIPRHIQRGLISQKDVKQHEEESPDVEGNSVTLHLEEQQITATASLKRT